MNFTEAEMDSHREQTCDSQGGEGWEKKGLGVWDWQMQTVIYRMISNKVLL